MADERDRLQEEFDPAQESEDVEAHKLLKKDDDGDAAESDDVDAHRLL